MSIHIENYYNNYDEDNRLLSRHGIVEYLTTMHYIEKYLKTDAKVLEIGAGTGRYSHSIAKKGYKVDAIELVEHNIEIFKKNTTANEIITISKGNAIDLSEFNDNSYDVTLLLGPMYHLSTEEEQLKALTEAVRVTKKGGIILSAYCMGDATLLTYGFMQKHLYEIISDCELDDSFGSYKKPWGIFQLYRIEDIKRLRCKLNVEPLHLVGVDGYSNHMRDVLAHMDDNTFNLYLKYHFSICERPEMLGISHHTLDIFKKK